MLAPIILTAVMGLVFAVILVMASKFMAVPVDETQVKVRDVLPGANCGACGFAGCDDYAAALAADIRIYNLPLRRFLIYSSTFSADYRFFYMPNNLCCFPVIFSS